jgi:MYXO-CTERM domain-containing protein
MTMRATPLAAAVLASLALASLASTALALQQPNGATIPSAMGCASNQPTGLLPVFACACQQAGVCNIGPPCPSATSCDDGQHGTCESTMWHSFNDNTCIPTNHSGLDPWQDAAIVPETFHPTCAVTYTVQSRGTAMFENAFGWYNAGPLTPDPSDLHVMLDCHAAAGTSAVLDLTKEPAWKGGDVAFFLVTPEDHAASGTCAGGDCCATVARLQTGTGYAYYTQRELNPDAAQGASPFIHVLTFGSLVWQQKYYFGWEDTFQTTSADFTDLVTSVSGVECSGAGLPCNTGKPGACANGVTECADGTVSCTQVVQPTPDTCNGVDDDCNGQVDDGATCPEAGDMCVNGACVQPCGSLEFECPQAGTQCDPKSGLCVDPKCIGVTCPGGQICAGGTCGTPCDGVVCPHGQTCLGNQCVDLCAKITCPSGQACAGGVCLPGCGVCGGITCESPLSCDATSGACADASCPNGCPGGTSCSAGQCVDDCQGAKCPAGQSCQGGQCVGPGVATPDGGFVAVSGGSSGGGTGGDGGAAGGDAPFSPGRSGCGCATAGHDDDVTVALGAAVALGIALGRRRARARAATGRAGSRSR